MRTRLQTPLLVIADDLVVQASTPTDGWRTIRLVAEGEASSQIILDASDKAIRTLRDCLNIALGEGG